MPTLPHYIYRKQGHYASAERIHDLSGRNSDGSFRTNVAKEYPPSFCLAISKAIVDSVRITLLLVGGVMRRRMIWDLAPAGSDSPPKRIKLQQLVQITRPQGRFRASIQQKFR
jgi:hypothetical protein